MIATDYMHPLVSRAAFRDPIWFRSLDLYERVRLERVEVEASERAKASNEAQGRKEREDALWRKIRNHPGPLRTRFLQEMMRRAMGKRQ